MLITMIDILVWVYGYGVFVDAADVFVDQLDCLIYCFLDAFVLICQLFLDATQNIVIFLDDFAGYWLELGQEPLFSTEGIRVFGVLQPSVYGLHNVDILYGVCDGMSVVLTLCF